MKKALRICLITLVAVLSLSLVALCASASTCTGELVNIAGQATVSGDTGPDTSASVYDIFWGVTDHYANVVDGDPMTVCPVDTVHNNTYGIRITFDGPYNFEKIVIQPYGRGRAQTSMVISRTIEERPNGQTINVVLYSSLSTQVFHKTYIAGKENIVIDRDLVDIEDVCQIYIWFENAKDASGYRIAQGIWEVEAYTRETHEYLQTSVTANPTCTTQGANLVRCINCNKTGEGIVQHLDHIDKCEGECHNGCGKSFSISHQRESGKACSSLCGKCGTVQFEGEGHIADGSNPCSNVCVVCGESAVPDAYSIPKIWSTSSYAPYTYAKHVANPDDPCDTTCHECKRPNTVKAAHVPDPDNPCGVSTCAKCGANGVFGKDVYGGGDNYPHYRAEGTCSRVCGKCNANYKIAFAHEFVDENGNPYCGGTCKHCGGTWITEQPHTFTPDSPMACTVCNYSRVCEHEYDNGCDIFCNLCNVQRYGRRGPIETVWHVYDNSCDAECNDCKAALTPAHKFTYECQTTCLACNEARTPTTQHTYSDVDSILTPGEKVPNSIGCDDTCDVCGETRKAPHNFAYDCSVVCSTCFGKNPEADALHDWDNVCDTKCNTCSASRTVPHVYTSDCDIDCNTEGCAATRSVSGHVYDNACDTVCNVENCGYTRTASDHLYDDACDAECNICKAIRTPSEHVYDNTCDTSCNVCGATRTIVHTYDNGCDASCNVCGVTRAPFDHEFDDGVITVAPTVGVPGVMTFTCEICGATETEPLAALTQTEDKGMGTGAVVGIVAGSTIVAGTGGFSLFWFVIKKKTWADLIGVFKK